MSFGTPHDIATMHTATGEEAPGQQDEGADDPVAGPGRPKKYGSWGRSNSPFGRDALGDKEASKAFKTDKSPLQHNYRGGGPLSTESTRAQSLIKQLNLSKKSPEILKESLTSTVVDIDKGTILDENNLISNEKA